MGIENTLGTGRPEQGAGRLAPGSYCAERVFDKSERESDRPEGASDGLERLLDTHQPGSDSPKGVRYGFEVSDRPESVSDRTDRLLDAQLLHTRPLGV